MIFQVPETLLGDIWMHKLHTHDSLQSTQCSIYKNTHNLCWLFTQKFNRKELSLSFLIMFLCYYPWKPGFDLVGMMMHCLHRSVLWPMIPLCAAKGAVVVGSELGFLKACTANGLFGDVGKPHKAFLTPDHSWMKRMFFFICSFSKHFITMMYFHSVCSYVYTSGTHDLFLECPRSLWPYYVLVILQGKIIGFLPQLPLI